MNFSLLLHIHLFNSHSFVVFIVTKTIRSIKEESFIPDEIREKRGVERQRLPNVAHKLESYQRTIGCRLISLRNKCNTYRALHAMLHSLWEHVYGCQLLREILHQSTKLSDIWLLGKLLLFFLRTQRERQHFRSTT